MSEIKEENFPVQDTFNDDTEIELGGEKAHDNQDD